MSKDEAKAEVARLLLERAEMKRLGTDLSPDKLMLLKRLMYRLGMNNVKLQRREALLRLARRIGVKRYSEPTQPVQPSGPLAPWRNPAPQSSAPKKTTKALQALKEKAALVPVTDEPLPQPVRPANTSRTPSRRHQVDDSVRNVPGGFSLGTRNGRRAFLNYLSDTGEDRDFQHRVDEEVRYQAEQYEPDIDQDRMRQIAEDNNWTPDEMIGHISQYHPEAENAIREWNRIHAYRPMDQRIAEEARQPSLFDPNDGQGPPIHHRFDLHDELADPDSTWYSDSLMNYLQTYHPELNHRAINNTLNALDDQRQSEMQDGIERAEQNDREWYEQNMDTSDIEDQILEQMHDEMEQEGRWEDRGEEPEENDEDQTPQLNVVNSNEPPQQLPTAEPKPLTGGPQFGRWYGDDRVHTYRFQTPSGRPFTIDIGHYNEGRTKIDNLTFNDDRHSFDDTGKGEAAAVFDQVSQAVAAYMQAKKPHILTFSAATTDGQATGGKSRQNLYTALIKRIGQIDPNYAAAAIPSPGGGKNFVVFDRSMVDDVERMVQNKFGGRQVPIEPIILSRRHELLRRYAKIDGHVQAHPLVQGFPIENALRHLANDPNNHPSIRELAKVAVTGGKNGDGTNIPMALWALHDELHQHKHPAKDWYNWMSAADKIGLDSHVARAIDELHHGYRSRHTGNPDDLPWDHTPGGIINRAVSGTGAKPAFLGDDIKGHQAVRQRIHDRVLQLDSRWTPEMIDESLLRHRMRSSTQWLRDQGVMSPDDEQEFRNRDTRSVYPVKGNEKLTAQVKATRYRRILRRLARRTGVRRYAFPATVDHTTESGIKITHNKSGGTVGIDGQPSMAHQYTIQAPNSEPVNLILEHRPSADSAFVHWIGTHAGLNQGQNTLGLKAMREVQRAVLLRHPEVKSLSGVRVGRREQAKVNLKLARKPSGVEGLKRYGKSTPETIKKLEQAVIQNPNNHDLIQALADEYELSGDGWKAKNAHELRNATGDIRTAFQAYPTTPVILKKTVRGRDYAAHAPDEVIRILQGLESTGRRVHVHSGYVVGPQAGRDWLEESDVQGRIGVSRGLGVANEPLRHLIFGRSQYGTPVDGGHVVRIRDLQTGKDLYRHPQYHHGKIEIRPNPLPNNPEYTHGVFRDGENIANFKGNGKAEKWVSKMGLTLHDPDNAYQDRLSRKGSPTRYQMVAGDFLDALRRIRSSDQHAIRKTTEEIAAKLGLKPASTVDALHNSPAYSVPGVAQAIYANASPESVHAAAAWYGLTGNIPGMAVFHVRPDGPDMLHRFRMQGSGHDMIQKLDKAGITDRVLVPHRKGFDLLIPDRGGKMRDRVREFTQRQKTELQSSRGHFKLIGAADQAKAREMFRNTITDQERKAV